MFDLRNFVMRTLRAMAEEEPAYQVNRYALGWFDKEVLTAEDLAEIDILTQPSVVLEPGDEVMAEGMQEEEADERGADESCD